MAELYLAFLGGQGGFRKFVALKRVLPAAAQQEMFMKMFLDEARITAQLSHANIAQVYELAEDDNREPVLAMEFVAGQNLGQVSTRAKKRQTPLPVGFVARVLHDVLLGLHSAHHFVEPTSGTPMPVIHRDINPRNIMVTYAGGTKIIDFGIAKARGRLDTTQVGMVKGTLQYMSPEQVMQKDIDGRSDLFAASVVLYELLTGKHLFNAESDMQLFNQILETHVPPLKEHAPHVSDELAEVVMKGLARRPEDRWKSGREYARALDHAVPESFDDEQIARVMEKLFEDKIVLTRQLLQSTTTEASYANLRSLTEANDESIRGKALPPPERKDEKTDESSPTIVFADNKAPVPDAGATESDLAPVEIPTAEQRVPSDLEPTGPGREPPRDTAPSRRVPPGDAGLAATQFEAGSEPRPAQTQAEPSARKPSLVNQPTTPNPARKKTSDSQPRKPTHEQPARKPTAERERVVRKPTSEGQLLEPVPSPPVRRPTEAPPSTQVNWLPWLLIAVAGVGVLFGANYLWSQMQTRPEDIRPLQLKPLKDR